MCHILCIEDDAETRILLRKSLEADGMTVDTVWGGEKGLQAAQAGSFDCVLLDIMMPGMDGFDVLQALRNDARTKDIAVIIVSGLEDDDSQQRAFDLGVAGYFLKPIHIRSLIDTIRLAIKNKTQTTDEEPPTDSNTPQSTQ